MHSPRSINDFQRRIAALFPFPSIYDNIFFSGYGHFPPLHRTLGFSFSCLVCRSRSKALRFSCFCIMSCICLSACALSVSRPKTLTPANRSTSKTDRPAGRSIDRFTYRPVYRPIYRPVYRSTYRPPEGPIGLLIDLPTGLPTDLPIGVPIDLPTDVPIDPSTDGRADRATDRSTDPMTYRSTHPLTLWTQPAGR